MRYKGIMGGGGGKQYDPTGSKAYDKPGDPGIYSLIRGTKMGPYVLL